MLLKFTIAEQGPLRGTGKPLGMGGFSRFALGQRPGLAVVYNFGLSTTANRNQACAPRMATMRLEY